MFEMTQGFTWMVDPSSLFIGIFEWCSITGVTSQVGFLLNSNPYPSA